MSEYYQVTNNVLPSCRQCNKSYPKGSNFEVCKELSGKGKERRPCGGKIYKDLYLDWSTELLKDYSVMKFKDLRLYEEIFNNIDAKLETVKTGKTKETGQTKVDIQAEIEQAMRTKGVHVLSHMVYALDKFGQTLPEMQTKSYYKVNQGIGKITEYGYEELRPRFEAIARMKKGSIEGYMQFKKLEEGKDIETKYGKTEVVDKVTCKCGFKAKSAFGLKAHQRACKKK